MPEYTHIIAMVNGDNAAYHYMRDVSRVDTDSDRLYLQITTLKRRRDGEKILGRISRWCITHPHVEHDPVTHHTIPSYGRVLESARESFENLQNHVRCDARTEGNLICAYAREANGGCTFWESTQGQCLLYCARMNSSYDHNQPQFFAEILSGDGYYQVPPWSHIIQCECCGRKLRRDQWDKYVHEGKQYDKRCYELLVAPCTSCGTQHYKSDMQLVDNQPYCARCYESEIRVCECCGAIHSRFRLNHTMGGGYACNTCADRLYTRCYECEVLILASDAAQYRHAGNQYCRSCYHEVRGRVIQEHNYKPNWVCLKSHKDTPVTEELTAGLEIETDDGRNRNEYAAELAEMLGDRAVLKTDGSLHRGVEIVTMPATFVYHHETDMYREIEKIARKHGFDADNTTTCGLHVHMSRHLFTEKSLPKFIWLYHTHRDKILAFTRRNEREINSWAAFYENIRSSGAYPGDHDLMRSVYNNSSKYRIVNISHRQTIEIRAFKGTIQPHRILACLEQCYLFADIAANWCEIGHNPAFFWSDVIQYAEDRGDNYGNFLNCCKSLGMA